MSKPRPVLRCFDDPLPDLSAAGEPVRSPPPAPGSSVAHSPGGDGPPTVPADLWSELALAASRAGLDPLVLLCMLARRGLEAMARLRGGQGGGAKRILDTPGRRA